MNISSAWSYTDVGQVESNVHLSCRTAGVKDHIVAEAATLRLGPTSLNHVIERLLVVSPDISWQCAQYNGNLLDLTAHFYTSFHESTSC